MPKAPKAAPASSSSPGPEADVKPAVRNAPYTPPRKPAHPRAGPTSPHTPETKPDLVDAKHRPPKSPGEKGQKTAWSVEEDAILVGLMHDLIKTHLWGLIKADGRIVGRTSYGAQYHARLLLAKGVNPKLNK